MRCRCVRARCRSSRGPTPCSCCGHSPSSRWACTACTGRYARPRIPAVPGCGRTRGAWLVESLDARARARARACVRIPSTDLDSVQFGQRVTGRHRLRHASGSRDGRLDARSRVVNAGSPWQRRQRTPQRGRGGIGVVRFVGRLHGADRGQEGRYACAYVVGSCGGAELVKEWGL